ncbi:hypothetical protein [Telluria beijingensis]|uniref:hypothetical protein n=1 Tax=Telluria beijingensis TaxID=3068633 RepID=UPI0027954E0F|nr:hypothetical protein [Massilia sp. REN29]
MADLPQTFVTDPEAEAYVADPHSTWRVKLAFRVDFTNGGYVEGRDFLLDIPGPDIAVERAAAILVSSMNLLRAGPVTIQDLQVVRRGEHDDR